MNQTRQCEECGAELPRNTPEGLCAKCLLQRGLESQAPGSSSSDDEKTTIDLQPSKVTVSAPPREGQRFGDYQLIRLLGEGGMGAVYEAEHLPSERRLALKVLNHALDSPEARKRFLREGQLAAAINHPNSVYVFGTEEIDGIPVISMELARGGTLKDRVKVKGPLPVTEAVDVILQVIAGLEAAQAKGVLHRDIKPANCFVDADGTVKVGDFGLSISTLARTETQLTTTGTFMGTPAFASPEQLKGEEMDVRSDIYSVGVTLYYLLTGRSPFEQENLVKLLATVLDSEPESPTKLRPQVPKDLAKAVLRCLSKRRENRPQTYDELRGVLLPFSSSGVVPATLGLRFVAGCIDFVILVAVIGFLHRIWLNDLLVGMDVVNRVGRAWLLNFGKFSFLILYFALAEGIWNASPGKALFGFCVVRKNGDTPGVATSFVRALVFWFFVVWLGVFIKDLSTPSLTSIASVLEALSGELGRDPDELDVIFSAPFLVSFALLFATVGRKHNGLHDLLSKTRVITRRKRMPPSRVRLQQEPVLVSEGTPQVGPYHVLKNLGRTDTGNLFLGYDARLFRRVWIRTLTPGTPPLPEKLRNLNRPARLRWLNGKRTASESWDAYEAFTGQPMLNLLNQRCPWARVRHWLLDLAEELSAGLKDQSIPEALALNRVWVTDDGRVKLLDFAAPGVELSTGARDAGAEWTESAADPSASAVPVRNSGAQLFLHQVAKAALEGNVEAWEEAPARSIAVPLPLAAGNFLETLRFEGFETFETVVGRLRRHLTKKAFVSRWRRLVLILGCAWLPLFWATDEFADPALMRRLEQEYRELRPLSQCLQRLEALIQTNTRAGGDLTQERQALETYIAGRFRDVFVSRRVIFASGRLGREYSHISTAEEPSRNVYLTPLWQSLCGKTFISGSRRKLAEHILAQDSGPSAEDLAHATTLLKPFLEGLEPTPGPAILGKTAAFQAFLEWSGFDFAKLCLIFAFLLRGGLVVHMLRIAVVRSDGLAASNSRVFGRSLITWSPILLIHFLLPYFDGSWVMWSGFGLLVALFLSGAICTIVTPERGLQDRLAGTWLVPR